MLLTILFSFRNEEENIPELVRRTALAVQPIDDLKYEMLFVNDQSTDGSLEVLKELRRRFPIRIVNMSRRFGVTPCILAGMAHARGDAVVYLDADLQDPPEVIPQMMEKFRGGADVVHSTRTERQGERPGKLFITRLAYRTINAFSAIDLPENTGDFKLLSRRAIDTLLTLPEYDPYLRGLAVWVGFKQDFVYYRREIRFGGETHFPLIGKGPIREFIRGVTAFSAAPLYFAALFGFTSIVVAVGLSAYAIITKLSGVAAQGAPGILIALAFFSGVIMLTNGVIGIYVARIYNEVKRRPRYIIKDIIE